MFVVPIITLLTSLWERTKFRFDGPTLWPLSKGFLMSTPIFALCASLIESSCEVSDKFKVAIRVSAF